MKNLFRAAAIAVASTALVAGGATAATASGQASPAALSTDVSAAANVSTAVAPYPIDPQSKIRVKKIGKKLTFRFTAGFRDDAGRRHGIRKVTLQVKKNHKWRTVKNVKLKSNGTGKYKRSDRKKRNYRMLIKPTSLYQGGHTVTVKI
jgi:hypothetical protein